MMSRDIILSDRMAAVANMVTAGNVVCDVGCDHGFVSIFLVKSGRSPRVIAMDINQGPIAAAREHIGEYGLEDYIETRLSDGVEALQIGEADTLICAGMGGKLMQRILELGRDKISVMKELVLQPQSEIAAMRKYLREQGHLIVDEAMIYEDGKYYQIFKVRVGKGISKENCRDVMRGVEDKYGSILLHKQDMVLYDFLIREKNICEQILENLRQPDTECSTQEPCTAEEEGNREKQKILRQEARRREILEKMKDIEFALGCYTRG